MTPLWHLTLFMVIDMLKIHNVISRKFIDMHAHTHTKCKRGQ